MTRPLTLAALALVSIPVATAQTWSGTVPGGSDGWMQEARELANGEIVALERPSFFATRLLRFDANGSILAAHDLSHWGKGIWPLSSGNVAVVGTVDEEDAWVTVLDATGTTLWSLRTSTEFNEQACLEAVRETADGGLITVGWTVEDDCDRELLAYRFDAAGNLLWDYRLGDASNFFAGFDVLELPDGSFRMFGLGSFSRVVILELDAAGSFVGLSARAAGPLWDPHIHAELTSDGNVLVVPGSGTNEKNFFVMKVTTDGALLWANHYGSRGLNEAVDIVPTSDGGGVVVGNTTTMGSSKGSILLMRLDAAGAIVWQRLYGGPKEDEVFALSRTADGGFLVSGRTRNGTSGAWDSLILRLDAAGEIAGCPPGPGWTQPVSVGAAPSTQSGPMGPWGKVLVSAAFAQNTTPPVLAAVCLGGQIGTRYCTPATPNSTGVGAVVWSSGSTGLADNQVTLAATAMPAGKFGYFLTGRGTGVVQPPSSQGNLCLDGATIFRYAADVQNTGPGGAFGQNIDVNQIPGHGAIQPGETWNFQAWFRDNNPSPTSNFTDAVGVLFL